MADQSLRRSDVRIPIQPARARRSIAPLAAALMLVAAACAPAAPVQSPGQTPSPATGSQGTGAVQRPDIPSDTVRFAWLDCCPDLNLAYVAIREGFFEDVGITIEPEGGHHFTDPQQSTPAMQRGDHDIIINFIQGYLQTLNTFGMDIPPIAFHDIYLGISILKAPDAPGKTTQELIDEGMSFTEAARTAVEQIRGQEVATPAFGTVQPQQPIVYLSYADMTYDDLNITFIDDEQILQLAAANRLDWAIPLNAGSVVQMIRNGWEPLIDTAIILEHDPESEQANQLTQLVGSTGLSAQRSFVDEHHDTVLRFLSAWWRNHDYVLDPANKETALKIVADTTNATQGTDLTPDDIAGVYEVIDPLFPWDQQAAQLWEDPDAPFYVRDALQAQIQSLIDNGTLPDQEYDIDRFLVAEDLYFEMKELQEKADGLFEEAEGRELSTEAAALVEEARQWYDWHNYLDAVRFLEAALQ